MLASPSGSLPLVVGSLLHLQPHGHVSEWRKVKGQRNMLTGSNLFVFSTQRFLFISLCQNRVTGPPLAVWIKRRLARGWFSQPTSSTPPQILVWNSFLRSLFSCGYLIVFTGSSEAPDSSLSVEAMFYHILHPAWWLHTELVSVLIDWTELHSRKSMKKSLRNWYCTGEDPVGSTGHVPWVLESSRKLLHVCLGHWWCEPS